MNPRKTQYIIFTGKKNPTPKLDVKLNAIEIEKVSETKFLGCILDERLKAEKHIEDLCKKLHKAIFVLKSLSKATSYDLGKLLYNAFFHSHVSHCSPYWSTAPKSSLNKLYALQRRALRVIAPLSTRPRLLRDLNILPLPLSITSAYFYTTKSPGRGQWFLGSR